MPADTEAKVWTTSAGKCGIALAARTVALAPGVPALLLTEETEAEGMEGRYWRHAVYLPREGKLVRVWSHDESVVDGDWTTTAAIPGAGGRSDIALAQVGRGWKGVAPVVLVRRLHLSSADAFMVGTELPDALASLFVVQVGSFKSVVEMREARSRCLQELAPLPSKLFPALGLPAFFLGGVFVRRDQADAARMAATACRADLPVNVVTWGHADGATRRLSAKRSAGTSEVRAFDWENATLPLESGDKFPFSRGLYQLLSDEDGCQVCAHIRAIAFGDVDGDGQDEALLAVGWNQGGAGTDIAGYILGLVGGTPILRATVEGGDRGEGGVESMRVEHGVVVVRRFESLVSDGACCPSRVKVERWRWADGELKQVGPTRLVRRKRLPWFRSP